MNAKLQFLADKLQDNTEKRIRTIKAKCENWDSLLHIVEWIRKMN